MATAEQLKALVRSFGEGDDARFYAVAMQVAARAAKQGHGRLADELRRIIDEAKEKRSAIQHGSGPVPVVRPRGELASVLAVAYPQVRLRDMVLADDLHSRLARVVLEQRQRAKLESRGLPPRRKLLLVGPPGTGKTMTAAAIAGELQLPMFSVLLDGLITKFLGETAAKLRLVFDAMSKTRGVYFFDEFDALGSQRATAHDVGEVRRVLNSFLQFLEEDQSTSLIVAATNHPELLDRALFRRFDDVLAYELLSPSLQKELLERTLAAFDTRDVDWDSVLAQTTGLPPAELVRAAIDAAKETVLADRDALRAEDLVAALRERRSHPR